MITVKFEKDWDKDLAQQAYPLSHTINGHSEECTHHSLCAQTEYEHLLQNLHTYFANSCVDHNKPVEMIRLLVKRLLAQLDINHEDSALYRLFQALNPCKHRVHPFTATQDYCMRIQYCSPDGKVQLTISPIYHYDPTYHFTYKKQMGKELANEAVIGLVQYPHTEQSMAFNTYSLCIDAGVAFDHDNFKRQMTLDINTVGNKIAAQLQCGPAKIDMQLA